MRVVFNTPQEFLAEITAESDHVVDGILRMRVDREPEQPEAVTFQVGVWLTAVIATESGGYLVEFGGVVGSDDTATPRGGSEAAEEIYREVKAVCEHGGLELRDGKIETI